MKQTTQRRKQMRKYLNDKKNWKPKVGEKSEINMHSPVCDDHNPHSKSPNTCQSATHSPTRHNTTQHTISIFRRLFICTRFAIIKLLNIKNYRNDMISGETMGRCLYKRDDKSNDMIKWMCNIFKSSICVCAWATRANGYSLHRSQEPPHTNGRFWWR